jgi:hypothetical protein
LIKASKICEDLGELRKMTALPENLVAAPRSASRKRGQGKQGVAMPTSPEPEKTTPHEFAVPADENNDAKIRNQGQSLHHGIDAPGY